MTPQRVAVAEGETEVRGQTGVGPTNSPRPRVTLAHAGISATPAVTCGDLTGGRLRTLRGRGYASGQWSRARWRCPSAGSC